jgi:hypothetical protein
LLKNNQFAGMKILQRFLPLLFFMYSGLMANATIYYVSYVAGNDANPGNQLHLPFRTIPRAVTVAVAGDTIYVRGETHVYNSRIRIQKSGTAEKKFYLLAYPLDPVRPLLDFSGMAINSSNRGIQMDANYWHVKGLDIFKAGDNGMFISGGYNVIEFCSFFENYDTGLQLGSGAHHNQIINCDAFFNRDLDEGNADGFAAKLDVGTGNAFRGCRAWQNSDDGWDGYIRTSNPVEPQTTYDSCWCFLNGYRKDGTPSTGNGNGFKMGGSDERNEIHDVILRNCLAVQNRNKGFDQNNNAGSMILYNNTGYRNGQNYGMNNRNPAAGRVMALTNNISFSHRSQGDRFASQAVFTTNSWQTPFVVTADDFVNLDTSQLRGPRNADGSLPFIQLMQLANGSDLIDGGTPVGLPFFGSAPDLGYAESNFVLPVQMVSFNGQRQKEGVLLQWKTATEINNHGWYIERLLPGSMAWQRIGFVAGSGNLTGEKSYQFMDTYAPTDKDIQYRLRQQDFDGRHRYSHIVQIRKDALQPELLLYPNPVAHEAIFRFSLSEPGQVAIQLYDMNGRMLMHVCNEPMSVGLQSRIFRVQNLPAGRYQVGMMVNGKHTATVPMVKR